MNLPDKRDPRRTIYLGASLESFLDSGRVRHRTESGRLNALAARYDILVREALPRRLDLTAPELLLLSQVVRDTPMSEPDHVFVLAAKLQQMDGTGTHHGGADPISLAHRLRQYKQSELLAILDLAERMLSISETPSKGQATVLLASITGKGVA